MIKTPKITPRGSQILVKQDKEDSRESEHGIFTPGNVEQEQKTFGTVISVGPKITDVKKGDRVIYATFAGDKIKLKENGKEVEYVLLPDEDVLAFMDDRKD